MTIVDGIHRKSSDSDVGMPAFGQQLDNAQIASVTNYVRSHFANIDSQVTAEQVKTLRAGGDAPFIVRYVNVLMAVGGGVALLVLFALYRLVSKRKRR
jgi:D-sorbitol dehydrogenase (acceptor)